MRRNPLAVTGVVCALWLASGPLAGCRSRDEAPTREQAVAGPVKPPAPSAAPAAPVPAPASKMKAEEGSLGQKDAPAPQGSKSLPPQRALAMKVFGGDTAGKGGGLANSRGALGGELKASLGGLGLRGAGAGGGGVGLGSGSGGLGAYGTGGGSAVMVGRGGSVSVGHGTLRGGSVQGDRALAEPPSSGASGFHDSGVNPFVSASEDRLSTFSIDVDTASYTLARRSLVEGALPPREAVRVEEFLNYFRYSYPEPEGTPLAVHLDAAPSPFTPGRHLLRVGVQGKHLSASERKPAHLTFLVDVSGSMQSPDRLPLAKRALRMLVDNLRDGDTVALVTYAGGVKVALPPTGMEQKARIHAAIEDLTAGGSTAMASGIELAYQQAMKTLDGQSVSRVLILSDGDANVGPASHGEILKLIRGYVKEGITVTTVGFGMGNYKDSLMEQFADQGNGNHYYVDSLMAARRIFQEQLGGTLEVIAQDVKLQVEFDPAQVARYRLVGYENRAIADIQFRDDKVDAGELGAGHTVTALYELELKPGAGEGLATVRVRAKPPRGEKASEREFRFPARALVSSFAEANPDLRFATAVMGAAELLRQSPHARGWSFEQVHRIARGATPAGNAEREEFLTLLERARPLVERVAKR